MLESQNIKNILQDIDKKENGDILANEIGNKLSDFEILQVLGQGAFGFVAKVRSRKNLKIYAMKKVDLSKVKEEHKKYYENESIFLAKLNHPNVCKLFSSFREGNNNYMILELLDNGDLYSFLKCYIKLKKHIPEEKLWNIFEQCLNGLVYIHSKGVINRDIKPTNILYGSNGECKITDFNIASFINMEKAAKFINDEEKKKEMINQCTDLGSGSFKAPEVLMDAYDETVDVYSLGITFCTMAFQKTIIPKDESKLYSKELLDIISLMIAPKQYRPSSKEMYNYFIRLYVDKYMHMSSLVSCINCLSCYTSLTNYFKCNGSYIESNKFNEKEKEITKQFNRILKALDEKKNINLKSSILSKPGKEGFNYLLFKLKELLLFYGIERKNDNLAEIEPIHFINFILNKLHGELNTKIVNKGIKGNCLKKYVTFPNNPKQEAYDNYMIFYNSNYKSNISDNFFGMIKTKKICLNCNLYTYSFNMFSYLPFKVEIMAKAYQGKNNLNIFYAFDCLNKNFVYLDIKKCVKCKNCNTYTNHNELKQFFNLPKNLIIFFDRGQNYEHKNFIDFPDILELDNKYVERFKGNIAYKLLGIICRVEDDHKKIKFLSFTKSGNNNNYINFEDKKQYNFENIKKCGIIIGLFYFCSYVKEHEMDNVVIDYLNNINNKNDNKENNNNENKNICIDNKNNSNNDDNLNDDEINTQIIFKKKKKSTCKNSINTTMNLLNQNNLNNNSNNSNVSSQNNNFKNIQNSLNNISNNSGYVQNNNFNNDQNNFNNSSNNSTGFSQNNYFNNGQNNFNYNSNNSINGCVQNNNINQISQNNFNTNSFNSSNNSSNGLVQNNDFNQFGQNNFNNNSNNSNNFNQFPNNNFNNNSNNSNNGCNPNYNFNNNSNNFNQFPNNNFNNLFFHMAIGFNS